MNKHKNSAPSTKNIVRTAFCLADCFSPDDGVAYFLKGKRYRIYTQGPGWMSLWDEEGGRQFISAGHPHSGFWDGAFKLPAEYFNAEAEEVGVTISLFGSPERVETNVRARKH